MKNLQKPMQGEVQRENSPLDGCDTRLRAVEKTFTIKCKVDVFAENRRKLNVGQTHKKIGFDYGGTPLV
ncbi:MAG TPA: hypothetical protein VHQ04_09280, partial [Puia sp.]|nr:hypothetical protein [Puia sp.]